MLDGKPFRIVSGAIHYFRVVPEYWEDSLRKLKACGFNTVETYACWNMHERKKGEFDFSGPLDIERFLSLAQELGLKVIFRPGPYVCAEWEWGGFPAWLLNEKDMELRCDNPAYLGCLETYLRELYRHVRKFYDDMGGPIILTQVENEYGSYGNDAVYMRKMRQMLIDAGATGIMITADGACEAMLTAGMTEGCMPTVNFGAARVISQLNELAKRNGGQPLMSGEFWGGQFDHWEKPRRIVSSEDSARALDEILTAGASVNFYMFHGGTNFGLLNGANYFEKYYVTTSSYDYNAPLSEAGDRTEKYYAIKAVLEKHFGPAPAVEVSDRPKHAYGKVTLDRQARLLEQRAAFPEGRKNAMPFNMEALGQDFGFVLYSTKLIGPMQEGALDLGEVRDRAQVFVNGEFKGVIERDGRRDEIRIKLGYGERAELDILVENRGRVNFGSHMRAERKGLIGCVRIDFHGSEQMIFGWHSQSIPLDDISALRFAGGTDTQGPIFLRGDFDADTPADTFLYLPGFTRGMAFVNGRCLGRYLHRGPQQTLYIPAPWLKKGKNELTVLELDMVETREAQLLNHPILDELHTDE